MWTVIRRCDGAHNTMDDDRLAPQPPFPRLVARDTDARGLDLRRSVGAMDAETRQQLDAITRLASAICQAPIAQITLIDDRGSWFVSRVGLVGMQTPQEQAPCDRAVVGTDVLVIPDALADPRFACHAAVLGEPHIRFYARVPLIPPEGLPLGALCVMDRRPRHPTDHQIDALRTLGRVVLTILAKRDLERQLAGVAVTPQAGAVAHDLHNALAPIISVLEVLGRRQMDMRSQEMIALALASGERITQMVRRMRGVAQGADGRRPAE